VVVDVLHWGDDQGVGLESGRVQNRNVQEVTLAQRQPSQDHEVAGILLNLKEDEISSLQKIAFCFK
jgi:hypothetical protein